MKRVPMHALLLCVTLIAGCSPEHAESPVTTQREEATNQPTDRIDIPATVRSNLGITFVPVERRHVASTIRVPGAFELQPLARHEYRMTLSGQVSFEVDQYDSIEPGDLLYRYRSPEWSELQHEIVVGEQAIETSNAKIAVAQAFIDEAEKKIALMRDRLDSLAEASFREASLETEVLQLEATLPRLRAELKQAETELGNAHRTREHALHRASAATGISETALAQLVEHNGETVPAYRLIDWIEVRAIESGVVEHLAVTAGTFAQAATLVLSTVDQSRVRFRAMALQADLIRFDLDSETRIVPPTTPGLRMDDGVSAALTLGVEAHPDQRTATLIAAPVELRPWIRPGVSAFLEVTADSTEGPALAIPRAAIVKDGIVHVFFRRDPMDPNKAIRTEADMGVSDGRWVAINSGLSLNDQIVLDGAFELNLASQQSGGTQKGGHFHADGTFHDDNK